MKVKDGMVVRIKGKHTNKAGQELEQTGTVIQVSGNDASVLLPDGNIWSGSSNDLAPTQKEYAPPLPVDEEDADEDFYEDEDEYCCERGCYKCSE